MSGEGSTGNPRRAQIIGIAAELFGRDGFHDTTMAAIADRAGVRKASLYWTYQWFDRSGPLSAAEVADRFHALLLGGTAARAVDHPAGLPSGG